MKAYISRKGIGIKTNEDIFHTFHAYVTNEEKNNRSIAFERIKNQYFHTENYTVDNVFLFIIIALVSLIIKIIFNTNIFGYINAFLIYLPLTYIVLSHINFDKSDKARLGAVNCFNNAYKSIGDIPTLAEIKISSYYKKKDIVAIMIWICISILISEIILDILIALNSPLNACILVFCLLIIVSILLIIFTNLSFIQRIYTKKPSYEDLSMIVDVANKVKKCFSIKGYINN